MRRSVLRLGPDTRQQWQQANSVAVGRSNRDSLYAESSVYRHSSLGDDDSKAPTLDLRELPDSSLNLDFMSDPSHSVSTSPTLSALSSRLSSAMWSTSSRPVSRSLQGDESRLIVPAQTHAAEQRHSMIEPVEQQEEEIYQLRPRRPLRRPQKVVKRGWFSRFRCRTVRSKIISCVLSGVFLAVVLSTCKHRHKVPTPEFLMLTRLGTDLALALSTRTLGQQFHVPLILLIIFTSIYFCHTLVRLCMLALRPHPRPRHDHHHTVVLDEEASLGIAPSQPELTLPAFTAFPEMEELGLDFHPAKLPPPAYGNWRGSVVSCSHPFQFQPGHYLLISFPARQPKPYVPAKCPPHALPRPACLGRPAALVGPRSSAVISLCRGRRGLCFGSAKADAKARGRAAAGLRVLSPRCAFLKATHGRERVA